MNEKRFKTILAVVMMVIILFVVYTFSDDKELQKEVVEKVTDTVTQMTTYEMSESDIKQLPSTEIIEQTEEQENAQEQEVEDEGFELQGEIAYEGDRANTWNVELGDYKGLTYYSQLDSRWSSKMYSSVNNPNQTIGSSGCGPTCASMIVTATKGTITPDTMSDLFVRYGYRSEKNGTYWSAFRAVADEFNIGYTETTDIQRALQLLQNNHYVVASCGNGLFTTGGHFIVLTKVENGVIEVYDPYLYAGKFNTSTRRGKATVEGNKVYVSVDNFKTYANAQGFFCYEHDGNMTVNNSQPVTTSAYTRYVKVNSSLNVRNAPSGTWIGSLKNGTAVTVYETSGNWSRIGTNRWVCSTYLASSNNTVVYTSGQYRTGTYRVNASVLNVRYGTGTNHKAKTYAQLSVNARSQNARLGNYYTNGYRRGVVCTVTAIVKNGNYVWAKTTSGYCCITDGKNIYMQKQ